jgi:hypothetical protein
LSDGNLGELMTSTAPRRSSSQPAGVAPLAALAAELGELGFEPQPRPALPGQVVYTATDSPVAITMPTSTVASDTAVTDTTATDVDIVHVHAEGAPDGHPWRMEWTATTPIHVQLIALYAILNHDPAAALSAAAAALGITRAGTTCAGSEPARRYPAG